MRTTYNAIAGDADCCCHVNRNRHNVQVNVHVVDGEIASASCSWCGKEVEVDRENLFQNDKFILAIMSDDYNKVESFLFEGKEYRGYPMGDKSLVK